MNKTLKSFLIISLLLLGAVTLSGCNSEKIFSAQSATQEELPETTTITFNGQEGQTALATLKKFHTVETDNYGELGEFVEAIDSLKPDADHFWAFYINGQPSKIGAADYQAHDNDLLEFKVEPIKK